MDDFLVRALIGGFGVAAAAGPLGSFVVWRQMAFFGDTLAHSALLGVALGIMLGVGPDLGVLAVCGGAAALLVVLQRRRYLGSDTLLGILSHGALALGLVAVALAGDGRISLIGYLFGDILAVTARDIAWIYGGGMAALAVLAVLWRPLLAASVNEDLARVEGVPVTAIGLAFMLLLALLVALAMKVVGVLLVTALLIVPAAAARAVARTPEQMALLAALLGCAAVAGGLWGSLAFDTPAGPSIVVAALVVFALSGFAPALKRR